MPGNVKTIGPNLSAADIQQNDQNIDNDLQNTKATVTSQATQISNEVTNRINGDNAEASARIAGDSAEQLARIAADNAHANSTTAHPASSITFDKKTSGMGSTDTNAAIIEAWNRIGNIIAGSGTNSSADNDATTLEPGYTPNRTITLFGDVLRDMQSRLKVSQIQTAALTHGWNYVLSDTNSPLNVKIYGTTRVNLLGKDGGCESLTGWTGGGAGVVTSTTQVKSGTNSFKATDTGFVYKDFNHPLDTAKQYILAGWVYIESYSSGSPKLRIADYGASTARYDASPNTTTVGSWQFIYVLIPTSNTIVGSGFRLYVGDSTTSVVYFDSIRLYEISTADSIAIGTTYTASTSPSIDDIWSYVDSVQHLENPILTVSGKNLLPRFTEWTPEASGISASEPYVWTINATGNSQGATTIVPAIPNTNYTMNVERTTNNGFILIQFLDKDQNFISTLGGDWAPQSSLSFTTPANAHYINVGVSNYTAGAGTFTFTDPILVLGSSYDGIWEAKNDSYLYGAKDSNGEPIRLASNIDGSVRDEIYYQDNQWYALRRFKTGVLLDSSFTWEFGADYTGFKRVRSYNISSQPVIQSQDVVKYDGSVLRRFSDNDLWDVGDKANIHFDGTSSFLDLTVRDVDSGWGENYTPSADEIKAYFYGYKMYPASGAFNQQYDSGTKAWCYPDGSGGYIAGGTTLPTSQATNVSTYELSYQLATTVQESVSVEGSLSVVEGGNQISLGEGLIDREPATPKVSTNGSIYGINYNDPSYMVAGSKLKNRASKIIAIYKSGQLDTAWTIADSGDAYGSQLAHIAVADYDAAAEYTVSYTALDKNSMTANATDAEVDYQTSDHSVLGQVVEDLTDAETQITINKNAIIDIYARLKAGGL